MEGDRERKTLLKEKHSETLPQISPDDSWMAYYSGGHGLPVPEIVIESLIEGNPVFIPAEPLFEGQEFGI